MARLDLETFLQESYSQEEIPQQRIKLQALYEALLELYGKLTIRELETIWYIRNLNRGAGFNYYSVAKRQYEALQGFYELCGRNPTQNNQENLDSWTDSGGNNDR